MLQHCLGACLGACRGERILKPPAWRHDLHMQEILRLFRPTPLFVTTSQAMVYIARVRCTSRSIKRNQRVAQTFQHEGVPQMH